MLETSGLRGVLEVEGVVLTVNQRARVVFRTHPEQGCFIKNDSTIQTCAVKSLTWGSAGIRFQSC